MVYSLCVADTVLLCFGSRREMHHPGFCKFAPGARNSLAHHVIRARRSRVPVLLLPDLDCRLCEAP
eukprot:2539220-Rhodomonas_salina.1